MLASSTAKRFMIALLALVALAITVIAICVGPVSVPAGKVFAALTGQTTSPGIFDVLVLLGREESLARIDAQAGTD